MRHSKAAQLYTREYVTSPVIRLIRFHILDRVETPFSGDELQRQWGHATPRSTDLWALPKVRGK